MLVLALFLALIVREWRHHPWRHGVALLAVALGVALAFSVHLINNSALSEFSAAVRAANGEPDLTLRGPRAGFDDALFERVAADPGVQIASPVLEIDTYVKVIVLTCQNDQSNAMRAVAIGAYDFLAKPFELAELEARLLALIRRARGGDRPRFACGPLTYAAPASSSRWPTSRCRWHRANTRCCAC
jgi:DNA-binding NarL/FixJ family response regulator